MPTELLIYSNSRFLSVKENFYAVFSAAFSALSMHRLFVQAYPHTQFHFILFC